MATFSPGGGGSNTSTPSSSTSTSGGGPGTPSSTSSLVDWNTMIKPFVTYSVGTLSKNELLALMKGIIESKPDFVDSVRPEHPHKIFYDVVTVLSAHVLTMAAGNSDLLTKSSYSLASQVSKILCESLIARFSTIVEESSTSPHPIVTCKTYINVIQELCTGSLILHQDEITGMLALLKNESLPIKIQSTAPSTWDKDGTSGTGAPASPSTVKEGRRSRLDPSVLLYDSIALPVLSIDDSKSLSKLLSEEIIRTFQSLRAGPKFINYCLFGLPTLKILHSDLNLTTDHIRAFYGKFVGIGKNVNSSPNFNQMSEDLTLIYKLLSLPLFSPLTEIDAQKITELGAATLFCSFVVIQSLYGTATQVGLQVQSGTVQSTQNEEDYSMCIGLVSQVIWTEKRISDILKENVGLPQKIWLNFSLALSKLILHSTQCYMNHVSLVPSSTPESKKIVFPAHIMSLVSVQSVWNELITAISKLGLELIDNFINLPSSPLNVELEAMDPGILTPFSVSQDIQNAERITALFGKSVSEKFNGIESLVQIMTLSYRKACKLKMAKATSSAKSRQNQQHQKHQPPPEENPMPIQELIRQKTKPKELPPSTSPFCLSTSSISEDELLDIDAPAPVPLAQVNVEIDVDDHENASASDFVTTEDEDEDVDVEDDEEDEDDDEDDDDEDIDMEDGVGAAGAGSGSGTQANDNENTANLYHDALDIEIDTSDDEPILGKWFETVLSSVAQLDGKSQQIGEGNRKEDDRNAANAKKSMQESVEGLIEQFIRDKSCPHGFIESALTTLTFLTKDIVSNPNPEVREVAKSCFNDQMLTLIAVVMKDLDQEKSCTDSGAISTFFDDRLNHLFYEFSAQIGKLTQNLIASNLLTQPQITYLLEQLKIDLSGLGRWSFSINQRSLAVLVQVLLLKPLPEKEAQVVTILKRFLDTLVHDIVSSGPGGTGHPYTELPVEHAQTLAFLFHSLSLMQKKTIMIETASALIRASKNVGVLKDQAQVSSFSRLLLFFDYFLRQLYEPEIKLISQVQYNLFNDHEKSVESGSGLPNSRIYFRCFEIPSSDSSDSSSPKFYNLISTEPNYQENPKLDGLSMNFLMNRNETNYKDTKINYSDVIEGLFGILETEITFKKDPRAVQYFETLLNRIIFSLPPPWELIEKVTDPEALKRYSVVLYLLIWLPRLTNRTFSSWIRDVFSKQGLNAVGSEDLIQRTINSATEPKFHIRILNSCNNWLAKLTKLRGRLPGLVYAIESVLVHVKYNLLVNLDVISTTNNSSSEGDADDKDGPFTEKTEVELHKVLREILRNSAVALRRYLLLNVKLPDAENETVFQSVITITSEYFIHNSIATVLLRYLSSPYKQILENMKEVMPVTLTQFPPFNESTSSTGTSTDVIPCETYLRRIIKAHLKLNNITTSVKHILGSVVQLLSTAIDSKTLGVGQLLPEGAESALGSVLIPLLLDKSTEYCASMIGNGIDPSAYGTRDAPLSPNLVAILYLYTVQLITDEKNGLRKLVERSCWDKCVENLFDSLNQILIGQNSSDAEIIRILIFERDEKLIKELLKFIGSSTSPEIHISGLEVAKFLLMTTTPSIAHKLLTILAEEVTYLAKSFFSYEFFKSKKCTNATQSFFHTIQLLLAVPDEDSDQNFCKIIPDLIDEIIQIVNKNMRKHAEATGTESVGVVDGEIHHSFCTVLGMLVTMANLNSASGNSGELGNEYQGTATGQGHAKLFKEITTNWFQAYMSDAESYLETSSSHNQDYIQGKLKALELILEYMLDVGRSLQFYGESSRGTTGSGNELFSEWDDLDNFDSEFGYNMDDPDDEESGVDESDEESLNCRLCTYTITQKEFMSQHWYHCHTCGMFDRVGVCSICARVCHRGHDVSYSKFGSFFCDCGARPGGTCMALSRRTSTGAEFPPTINGAPVPQPLPVSNPIQQLSDSSEIRRLSPPPSGTGDLLNTPKIKINSSNISELQDSFKSFISTISEATLTQIFHLVQQLSAKKTSIGAFKRVQEALAQLRSGLNHELEFTLNTNDELIGQFLSSQEGAFDNIKLQYNGDQGSTIRQLITSGVIKRNAIMTLSAPNPRRTFLAVSHEKGKLHILQLASFLSGGDHHTSATASGKKSNSKVQIPRLGSVTLPFTCLTMSSNPIRDDALAVCGLKDCQVIVIGTGGTILNQISLKVGLDNQNYIIKPIWIPGSQTELALLTSDGVKIYDLSRDPDEPTFHFLLPSGKVRDATFVIQETQSRFILLMGTDGRIYSEKLDENTSATNGPYYITNDLNYDDTEILSQEAAASSGSATSTAAASATAGVSLYYSHSLRLLFYTYPNGKSYVGTLENLNCLNPLTKGFLISPNSKPLMALGLSNWTEVYGHPGLIFAMGTNSTPYTLFLSPNGSYIQEIRLPGKVKPVDMVCLRHTTTGGSNRLRTSALTLCDDGALKVQTVNEITEFWLSPRLRPHVGEIGFGKSSSATPTAPKTGSSVPGGNKLVGINKRMAKFIRMPGNQLIFIPDFFEHCQLLTEIEFGGNDLLQVYNPTQLKTRLADPGLYVVSSKSIGFNLEITSTDGSMVITGIRVNVGVQDVTRNPSFIQINGRSITVAPNRSRWYDIPLTREESLHSDSKLTVTFGPSNDPSSITVVDTVKVYGRTKEAFAWPDDSEEGGIIPSGGSGGTMALTLPHSSCGGMMDKSVEEGITEKIVLHALDLCDIGIKMNHPNNPLTDNPELAHVLDIVTKIYLENYPPFNSTCRSLMATVFMNQKSLFNDHRDKSVLSHCLTQLMSLDEKLDQDIDPELFHHLVMCIKNIAIARPTQLLSYHYEDIGHGPMDITRLVRTLCSIFLKLVAIRPQNLYVVAVDRTGIQRVSHLAWALTEIIYAVMSTDNGLVEKLSSSLIQLLLSKDPEISIPIKSVFIRRMKPKSRERKQRKAVASINDKPSGSSSQENTNPRSGSGRMNPNAQQVAAVNPPLPPQPQVVINPDAAAPAQVLIEDYMEDGDVDVDPDVDGDPYPPVIDIQSDDAEDEAMVELAIALSLQEQAGGAALAIQNLQEGLQALENIHHDVLGHGQPGDDPLSPPEPDELLLDDDEDEDEELGMGLGLPHGHGMDDPMMMDDGGAESDATASPPPSDDEEGSPAAPQAVQVPEPGGSDSSGSGGSGPAPSDDPDPLRMSRRRRYPAGNDVPQGPNLPPPLPEASGNPSTAAPTSFPTSVTVAGPSSSSATQLPTTMVTTASSYIVPNKPFRLALLRAISKEILNCESMMTLIPLLQIPIQILSDLDGSTEEEIQVVESLMTNLVQLMRIQETSRNVEWKRNPLSEICLVILRMFCICICKLRSSVDQKPVDWVGRVAATTIQSFGIVDYLKELLYSLRQTWKVMEPQEPTTAGGSPSASSTSPTSGAAATSTSATSTILRPASVSTQPDLQPFFQKPYVKGHQSDLLDELPMLITEMTLRIPYQIKKILPHAQPFDKDWEDLLCEVLQSKQTAPARRQARKLLLTIAGTREGYHLLRDMYHINWNLNEFQKLIGVGVSTSKDRGHFAKASEFKYSQLVSMVEHLNSCIEIASQRPSSWQKYCKNTNKTMLMFLVEISCLADESLTAAILALIKIGIDGTGFDTPKPSASSASSTTTLTGGIHEGSKDQYLTHLVLDSLDKRTFLEFIRKFLLEHPQLSTRWNAHALLYGMFTASDNTHQLKLINLLWELWPFVPAAGSRASQFVDILGYGTLNNDELRARDLREHVKHLVTSIESQGTGLLAHPNANIYSSLVPFVSVDGYYLESEPCEICYNVDKAYTAQKLSSVKADAKFTANHQFIKLTSTLNIVRLTLRLTEIKKARMIKSMGIYYSPKNISIVELKNHRNLWQLAKKATLTQSQAEVKLDFSVPITASNLILEFSDFYENTQGTSENLQCPRCSASVPSQPGVCSNCGENVYQCHKCRAINYDERDPFLCHSCGFCKYAKMDISLLSKNIVAVDPIENEEDHKKAECAINTFLEKADKTYKNQQSIKGMLETMLQSIKEKRSMAGLCSAATTGSNVPQQAPAPAPVPASASQSYASVAAAANALNNNIAILSVGGDRSSGIPISAANAHQLMQAAAAAAAANAGVPIPHTTTSVPVQQPGTGASSSGSSSNTSLVLKNVQSLAYCYAIDCKNSYEELNRVMRKVAVYRKELLKLDPTAYPLDTMDNVTYRRCYGCMAASITQSLKLLQALITAGSPRDPFDLSFLSFLLRLSQAAGSTALKEQVKNALCFFVKDDEIATTQLTDMITNRVISAFNNSTWSDLSFETSEEISLLASLLQMYDSCWEFKLRSLMKIFTTAVRRLRDPFITETCLLPCLKIIQNFVHAALPKKQHKNDESIVHSVECVSIDLEEWMAGNDSFEQWRKRLPKKEPSKPLPSAPVATAAPKGPLAKKKEILRAKKLATTSTTSEEKAAKFAKEKLLDRNKYLMSKYGRIWIEKYFKLNLTRRLEFDSTELNWIRKLVFSPGSIQTRIVIAGLLKDMAQVPARKLKIMELLMHFMSDIPKYGESCREFMELFRSLATPSEYSAFLNAKGALNIVCDLLDQEIDKLHQLETITLHSDLSQGVAVWELSRLLSTLAIPSVCRTKRKSLLSTVLGGYLALKRLRLHRTRSVNEAQEILLTLLEAISKGTEEETKEFMSVCVTTLKKCPKDDLTTPVFIFERLCSLIVHEESDVAEFYVSLEKDPQQEDFLQGRMLGNPYSSNDSGIGPLMRDIKNKICTDCELVALLEDDNGMELLVNNKIISLDLPVKEVYKRVWLPTNGQVEPMRIIYRMRGLMGDATEEFVETFTSASDGDQDFETTYKLANVLVQSEGLKVVLSSLQNLLGQPFLPSRGKPFIAVILKLLGYASKIKNGRLAFVDPNLSAIPTLLPILELCLEHDLHCIQGSSGVVHLADQVLEILDTILTDAYALDEEIFLETFAKSRGSVDDIRKLLQLTGKLKGKQQTQSTHLKVIGCLTFSDKEKMNLIFDNYADCLDFFKFDDDEGFIKMSDCKLEQICTMISTIQHGKFGRSFKDLAIERGVLERCLEYIRKRAPSLSPPMGRPDSEEWKEMVSKPALKYVLKLLAGLATDHIPTQESLSTCIHVIHQLEQVSSDEHVGSLAENTMEALRSHETIWLQVEAARRATREEKKRLAMAMRLRQLNAIGMKTNEKGQVTAATAGISILDQMEDFAEESGLVCVICREGYKYQPSKVLGIYTYSKRCAFEESESKSRKSYGYCTVSHFNVVHVDCHMAAIRLARARDEWESASLQNANTRCNGLIPLWGVQVPESAFAACLARHNAYLQEATGHRDVGFTSGSHDIKFLLLRFAEEKSFHEDTGGGGPESNCHLIPYLFHTALYVLNTTRSGSKELANLERFLNQPSANWREDLNTIEGPYYYLIVGLMVQPPAKWMESRLLWLKRIMTMGGYKSKRLASAEFTHYRSGLIFLGMIHGLYTIVFKDVSGTGEWSTMLADYIRKNDEALLKSTTALLNMYQQKLLSATSVEEIVEILGLSEVDEVKDIGNFITNLWSVTV